MLFWSAAWKNGPGLPFTWANGQIIEDPLGGIVLIGGESSKASYSNALFRLPHAGQGAKWIEMPQKLSLGQYFFVALLVPDDFANCTAE